MTEACVWERHYDEDSNIYYYNTLDGSSQWDMPADFVENQVEDVEGGEYVYPEGYDYSTYSEEVYEDTTHETATAEEYVQSTTTAHDDTASFENNTDNTVYDQDQYYDSHTTDTVADTATVIATENTPTAETEISTEEWGTENYTAEYSEEQEHTSLNNHWVEEGGAQQTTCEDEQTTTYEHEYEYEQSDYTSAYGEGHEEGQWEPDYVSQEVVSEDTPATTTIHGSHDSATRTTEQEQEQEEEGEAGHEELQEEEYEQERKVEEEEQEYEASPELVDPATLVPHYSEEDQPIIDAILDFELNENTSNFLEELRALRLLDLPCASEVAAIKEGMWCKASCKKLEILQFCLEGTGTEDEWLHLVEREGGRIVEYLLLFMAETVHPQLQDGAGRCFAMMFMVCPTMWTFYGGKHSSDSDNDSDSDSTGENGPDVNGDSHNRADFVYAIWAAAGRRVQFLCALPADGPTIGPYLGFDERDIEEFNLYGLDEEVENEKKTSPFDMHGAPDANTMVSIWLLLLFQMCRSNMRQIGDAFRNRRVLQLGLEGEEVGGAAADPTDAFLATLTDLLLCSHKLKEDSSLILIKVIAAVNWQVPEKDLVGSTEIAELCAELQFQDISDSSVAHVNVSDLLMHLLNDIGYPEHDQPESLPCLQLCYDLIMSAGYEGFFYQNDVRILIDMIIREITNLPATKAKEEIILEKHIENSDSDDDNDGGEQMYRTRQSTIDMNTGMSIFDGIDGPVELFASEVCPLDELMKQMYLKIAYALLGRSCWQELDDFYRKNELDELLNSLLDSNEINDEVTIDYINRFLSLQLD